MGAASGIAGGGSRGVGSEGVATPTAAAVNSGAATGGGRQRTVDEEGFQRVERRGGRKVGGEEASGAGVVRADGERTAGSVEQRADSGATVDDGADGGDNDGGGEPTPEELRRAWLDEVGLVRRLRLQGVQGGHPALRAAQEARDAAERAWRGAKDPAPASVRLGRAQARLDRAVTLQADARHAIQEAERAHRDRMAALQATMDDCTERVRARREQLRQVQVEVGAGGTSGGAGPQARAQQAAIRQVHQTICGEVGPTIAALVEQLEADAPAWTALNGLLGKLSASKAALEEAYDQPSADHYDIGEGDHGTWEERSDWSESRELGGQAWGGGQMGQGDCDSVDDDGDGACRRRGARGGADDDCDDSHVHDQSMDTGDWWDAPARRWGEAPRWQSSGHGKWRRASWAEQTERELHGTDDEDGQPAAARRRLGDAETTRGDSTAREGGTADTAAAQAEDPESQKRLHTERLNRIITMAVDAGVTPLTKHGEDLRMLDPHQLDAWVAECLPSALLC